MIFFTYKQKKVSLVAAFSLVELLTVITIISLLATFVLSALSTARFKAGDARGKADLREMRVALESYFDKWGHYPTTGASCGTTAVKNSADANPDPWIRCDTCDAGEDTAMTELFAVMPRDQVNAGGDAWDTDGYYYSYRGLADAYDLAAHSEVVGDRQRAEYACWREHTDCADDFWASACGGTGADTPWLFSDH